MGDIPCPKDGCSKTCGSVPNLKNHIHMMSDSGHPEQGNDAWQLASQAAASGDSNDDIQHTDTQTGADTSDSGSSTSSGVTFTEAPQDDTDDSADDSETLELPCGCETVDMDEAPAPPFYVTCESCGQRYEVDE